MIERASSGPVSTDGFSRARTVGGAGRRNDRGAPAYERACDRNVGIGLGYQWMAAVGSRVRFQAGLLNSTLRFPRTNALDTTVVGLRVCCGRSRCMQRLSPTGSVGPERPTSADRINAGRRVWLPCSRHPHSSGTGNVRRKSDENQARRGEGRAHDAHLRRPHSVHRDRAEVSRHGDRLERVV